MAEETKQAVVEGVRVPFDLDIDKTGDGIVCKYTCRLCDYSFTQFEPPFETWQGDAERPMENRQRDLFERVKRHLELGHPNWREQVKNKGAD